MYHWTSESVGRGHPDKVADQISDRILDAALENDRDAKVAIETLVKGNHVVLAGEITNGHLSNNGLKRFARTAINEIGYSSARGLGFSEDAEFTILVSEQSSEIGAAVNKGAEVGAGDQGIMFGYACNDTNSYLPTTLDLSRRIIRIVENIDPNSYWHEALMGENGFLMINPDCKSQVTCEYTDNGLPLGISHIVLSMHHHPDLSVPKLVNFFYEYVLPKLDVHHLVSDKTQYHINPAGPWTIGGPAIDTGLTGRKIVVDNYGADCQIGGGAFSGKDPSKVDRSAAYAARHIAKNVVASALAPKCRVQLAYAIGEIQPISIRVDTMGSAEEYVEKVIADAVKDMWDLSPTAIIDRFNLKSPIYYRTASEGHFGHDPGTGFSWEDLDMADALRDLV